METYYIILTWSRIICFIFILLPFITYCLWIFWKDRHELYVQKRRPLLAVIITFMLIILSFYWVFFDEKLCYFSFCRKAAEVSQIIMVIIPLGVMMILIVARVWFLFYDLKYSEAILSHKWWGKVSNKNDWFVNNKYKYGVLRKWMATFIILLIICYILTVLIGVYYIYLLYIITMTLIMNGSWVFLLYIYCKMPKHYDIFLIHKELNIITIIYFVANIWFQGANISRLDEIYPFIRWLHGYIIMVVSMTMTAMTTLWPHFKLKHVMNDEQLNTAVHSNSANSNLNLNAFWISYVNQCEDDTNWNMFMMQLIREFAVENLCFILEAIQFKQQFIPNYNGLFRDNEVIINNDEIGWFIKLPKSLPISSIIDNNPNNYREQIHQIYDKYLSLNADLAVNISYNATQKFMNDMKNIMNEQEIKENIDDEQNKPNKIELVNFDSLNKVELKLNIGTVHSEVLKIFDAAFFDIDQNLDDSFMRFKFNKNIINKQDIINTMTTNN